MSCFNVMRRPPVVAFLIALVLTPAVLLLFAPRSSAQDGERSRVVNPPQQTPSPKPKPSDDEPLTSDEVIRTETNLTTIFFTAEDKNRRFINSLKQEDVRILEDGQPQQIFTFQQNTDLPLSLAILVDCSASEEQTLPEEKSAAREFLEAVLRANRDEAAIVSFTGEVT